MVQAFAFELLWLFARPEECHGLPSFQSPLLPGQATDASERLLFGAYLSHLVPIPHLIYVPRPYISLILDLIAVTPSPKSQSPTRASSAAHVLSIVKLIVSRHVHIAFFRFPFVNLAHIPSRLLIALCLMVL